MKNTKVINTKNVSNKVTLKKVKKVETKKVEIKVVPQKSISRLVFKFIEDKKLLESDNRKAEYSNLLALVQKDFPQSKFQKTHFFWYLSRAKKQLEAGLDMSHLVTIPEVKEVIQTKKVITKKK